MGPPLANTSQNSPDTLPQVGYSLDQLVAYLQRQLGGPIFAVELTKQQLIDAAMDALSLYSQWRPRIKYGAVTLAASQYAYLQGVDLGTGPAQVNFVQRTPLPQALLWGNLIGVAPLLLNGMDEYDMFMRWQKTWMRVTSVKPDWVYDEIEKILYIHNPIDTFLCGVVAYVSYDDVKCLDRYGANWVKQYALQKARHAYGDIMSKYSGMIPGPVRDLQLDQGKRAEATVEIDKLEKQLFAAQVSTGLSQDE